MSQRTEKIYLQATREDPWELGKLGAILRRRWLLFVAVCAVVTCGVGYRMWLQTPIYRQEFQLFLDTTTGEQFNPLSETNIRTPAIVPIQFRDFKTEMEILTSYKVISPLLPEITNRYPDLDYDKLIKSLKLKYKDNTAIVTVSYEDSNPEKVKFILDKLAQSYTAYSLEKLQVSSNQALKLVENQLPQLQNRVDQLQGELELFRRKYDLVDPEQQSKLLSDRIGSIIQQRQETEAMLGETQSTVIDLQQKLAIDVKEAMIISALSEAPRYLALTEELQKLDTQIAFESAKFTEGHPTLISLQEKRARLAQLIQNEVLRVLSSQGIQVANIPQLPIFSTNKIQLELTQNLLETASKLKGMQTRSQSLVASEKQARQDLKQFAATARKYADLSRNLEIANQSLSRFLVSRENLQIETARKVPPWQVISQIEVPKQPISPNPTRDLFLGGFAGVLAGLGAVIIAEKLNYKYRSPEELQAETQQIFLGTIPFHKQLQATPTTLSRNGTMANSSYWEAYISLQANLDFLQPDKIPKSLTISSALPGEGKSTISLYLAKVAAAMGKRVLLVDADLRRPSIHHYLDSVTNTWGLSNAISGVAEVEKLIQPVPEEENLHVLTAGQKPPNPAGLLSSQKMKDLISQFQIKYDLIIFDTPPLHGFADGKFIASQTDGLVMVVGLDRADKQAVKQVLNDLNISSVNLLGIVANGVKGYKPTYSSYYEHYYSQGKKQEQDTNLYQILTAARNSEDNKIDN
ncbi:MAG: polysaccharide biosynthesis tyrosine autokinase [Nostoc sp. C3-bin3]|nr:polysaccharide biosynthesis tyrosine autokinase [Nostoc sp. C3-bin3]